MVETESLISSLMVCCIVALFSILERISLILEPVSFTEVLDSSANFLTSSATTENPLPFSPALPASSFAFKAKRLVCSDTRFKNFIISRIPSAEASTSLDKILSPTADSLMSTNLFNCLCALNVNC